MFENFPYTDMHQLNLDWIIKIAKDFLDQYTHIQQLIEDGEESLQNLTEEGEQSLQNLTEEGLQSLQEKAEEIEGLLNSWYETHSQDIAQQLASALDDLNGQLNLNISSFNAAAEQKAADTIDSIPADYTALSKKVDNLIENNAYNITPEKTGTDTNNGITFTWNVNGSCTVSGTQSGGSNSTEYIFDSHVIFPTNFQANETYYVEYSATKTYLQVLGFKADDSMSVLYNSLGTTTEFDIPEDIVGLTIRLWIASGQTVNETLKPIIRKALSNAELSYNQTDLRPDVLQLQQDVSDLKQHELSMNFSSASNLNNINMWEQGSISPTTGENVVSSGRIRTATYLPTNISNMKLPTDERGFFICGYDVEDDSFMGVYRSDNTFTLEDDGSGYTEFNFSIIYQKYNNARLRVYLYSRDGTDISLDEASGIFMESIYNQLINPCTLRIMQYNIGQFNFGHDGGWAGDALGLKLSNYRKLMLDYHVDILTLQEYRTYVNSDDTANADYIIFNDVLPYKSYEEHGFVVFSAYQPNGFRHSYLHTSGDYPARMVYGEIICNNKQIAIGSAALNALGSSDDGAMKIRALTKMINLLENYDTAIIGIDSNVESETEANAIKTFMKTNGYRTANWDYAAYIPTYNPSNPIYKCIDTIFIKGRARFVNIQAVPDTRYNDLLSDHLPIIADVLIYK